MRFNVPQFLEIEDKIIGPLTLKQFGYMLAGGAILFILYQFLRFWLFVIIGAPVALLFFALAFIKVNGRPFVSLLGAFVNFLFKPKLFVWKKEKK